MKAQRRQISTARGVALVRAIEMTRPAAGRVASDPLARNFVNPLSVAGMRLVIAAGISRLIGIEGMLNFAMAREAHIEAVMRRELADGAQQIVILGAGFDTRAYRLPEAQGVPVFEVDHPATQADKRAALGSVLAPLPANVHFVAVDFDHDDLGERLRAAGYGEQMRTLFVWQGVIVYLTPDGADATLRFVAEQAAPGSLIIFDAIDSAEIRRASSAGVRFFTRLMGEKLTLSLPLGGIGAYLTARGLAAVEITDAADMARLHLPADRPIAPGVYIASARVPPRG